MTTSPENYPLAQAATPNKRRGLPRGCGPWLLAAFLVPVLAGLALPLFNTTCLKGTRTRSLAQAKQIGLALRLFAGDNEGIFPRRGVPAEIKELPANSNQAFVVLFPTYVTAETLFGNPFSAYQMGKGPDNRLDAAGTWPPIETLRPGENVYGYVMGLADASDPKTPLVVEGTDGSRHYNKTDDLRGGIGKEGKAIVIRVDNSGSIETLLGPGNTLYLPRTDDRQKNALDIGYLGKDVRYLDPAVAGP